VPKYGPQIEGGGPTAEACVCPHGEATGIVIEGEVKGHSGTGIFERGPGIHLVCMAAVLVLTLGDIHELEMEWKVVSRPGRVGVPVGRAGRDSYQPPVINNSGPANLKKLKRGREYQAESINRGVWEASGAACDAAAGGVPALTRCPSCRLLGIQATVRWVGEAQAVNEPCLGRGRDNCYRMTNRS
jgi:hypothetical protein